MILCHNSGNNFMEKGRPYITYVALLMKIIPFVPYRVMLEKKFVESCQHQKDFGKKKEDLKTSNHQTIESLCLLF